MVFHSTSIPVALLRHGAERTKMEIRMRTDWDPGHLKLSQLAKAFAAKRRKYKMKSAQPGLIPIAVYAYKMGLNFYLCHYDQTLDLSILAPNSSQKPLKESMAERAEHLQASTN